MAKVNIVQYEWAGRLGPIRIKTKCEECDITHSIIEDMIANEFKNKDVVFTRKPWLDNFFRVLFKGAYHPPILIVNSKKFHQFSEKDPLFNRKKLNEHVMNLLKDEI